MSTTQHLQLVECPRDAMQGWPQMIPAFQKVAYINALLHVGFHTIDFGSFVSPKAIPQMADTKEVLEALDLSATRSGLLGIVANTRGAEEAVVYDSIRSLGFPFSVSETFQRRNTNSTIEHSFQTVEEIQRLCEKKGKELVIYLSMGFGNPYDDPWSEEIVLDWAEKIAALGVPVISLADTVGLASPEQISRLTSTLIEALPAVQIGVHLHAKADNRTEKLEAAFNAGCRRFDGALKGIGGCPMAGDVLVGNMDTAFIISYLESRGIETGIHKGALQKSILLAKEVFSPVVL
ncbi:hydroxymethylglutaryl-CoA lyase [Flavihumibacter sp. CACIAM 22H1]|uniref:hydroxymethylglutaryl-CoA lyase n=1 Tax=Flavihumibacter sp. CACIAM 22H1 TaxID=1812911 RepID=UPI0007A7CDBE|nr:hydroxymethylglutaryl-CoA lyase [Flavihumibacter sp. CACIAM 22H1]KYP14969.1 MAG: hydroxymethylglutaryl-CoA lyase [Flavihumibacter sp. CACIAM 22H1]